MKIKNLLLSLFVALTCFTACDQDDSVYLTSPDLQQAESELVKLRHGDNYMLQPEFEANGDISYRWTLDGETVSNESTYNFSAEQLGKHQLSFELSNEMGSKSVNYSIDVSGAYSNGVFIVNEGWFGHESGSVHFWDRSSNQLQNEVYQIENPGKELGITTQYACVQNGHMYFVSKGYGGQKGNVVVANANTLKHEGTITLPNGQCRAFVALNETTGYLSTGGVGTANGSGVYRVNLSTNKVVSPIPGIGNSEVGNLLIASGKLFALRANDLLIINTQTNNLIQTIGLNGTAGGMVVDKNGDVWIAANSHLLKINPNTLAQTNVNLTGVSVNPSYGWAWNAGSLTYSKSNHSLYFVNGGGWMPKNVGCYHISNNQAENLFSVETDFQIYGAGTYIDPIANKLYVTALKGFGQDGQYNRLYVYDLQGNKERTLSYDHFYFTALCIAQ